MALIQSQGYVRGSQRHHLSLLEHFDAWLARRHLPLGRIAEEVIASFLDPMVRAKWVHVSAPATMRRLLTMLRADGVVDAPVVERTATDQVVAKYERFLVVERALSPATAESWLGFIRRLLTEQFGSGSIELATLTATDVIAFVQRHSRRYGSSYTRKLVVATRSFLRYLHYKGLHSRDLAMAVPKVARWKLAVLPKHLPADQVQRVLKACNRRTALGRRNYAILLLLARLGLRAGEVVALQLEDIDWQAGELKIRNGHTRVDRLPLPHDVGEALAQYLSEARPRCASRQIFVRAQAPLEGFSSGTAVAAIVRRAFQRAGIDAPSKGAHVLRHTLATRLLRQGSSLPEIGEVLRHRQQQTTTIYAKVDLTSLRSIAPSWPGGAQ